jgi:tRNA (guanine-N7-)-methyltransferase
VGKNKLARWAEMKSFNNVIEPPTGDAFGKDHPLKGNWNKTIFRNRHPIVAELGCGKGEYTVGLASRFSKKNFIGIDIKGARIWRGAKTAYENGNKNVTFLRTRIEFINSFFAEDEVDEIWITFPDPHPKRRDTQKRLTSPYFLNSYRSFLKNNGIVHLKTDNRELYNYTSGIVKYNGLEILVSSHDLYSGKIENEILSIRTHYENIFLKQGMKINYISFRLDKNKNVSEPAKEKHAE